MRSNDTISPLKAKRFSKIGRNKSDKKKKIKMKKKELLQQWKREELDRITNLPEETRDNILGFLPTRTAVSTSVLQILQSAWQHLYQLARSVEFEFYDVDDQANFIAFVDRVLDLRGNAGLDKFCLRIFFDLPRDNINRWIHYALDHGFSGIELSITELDFKLTYNRVLHEQTDGCGDPCRCCPVVVVNPSCLSVSPNRVLKVYGMGDMDDHRRRFIIQISHFLQRMPSLQQLVIYAATDAGVTSLRHLLLFGGDFKQSLTNLQHP
ncbi:hypothetical protein EUTSA_v10010897mg, partial [Eutrema salsugineum]